MADIRTPIPPQDEVQTIWTFQDAVEHLLDVHEIAYGTSRAFRLVVRAVDQAYRDLANMTHWSYYDREVNILTEADFTTGTITYDHTGGSSERLLTNSSATPSTWERYKITIADRTHRIDTRLSSTTSTLHKDSNPGADVAAGTTFTAFRESYPLPIDFRKLGKLWDVDNDQEIRIVPTHAQFNQAMYGFDSPDTPWIAAIRSTGEFYGATELVFGPPPTAAVLYSLQYEAGGQPLNVVRYNTGTITTDGTTAIVGSGTAFSDKHIGCIIRISSTSTAPTPKFGGVGNIDNLFAHQRVITAVTDTTNITVDSAVDTLAGVAFTISDPLDIEPNAMYTAFLSMCELNFAKFSRKKDWQSMLAVVDRDILRAMDSDQRMTYGGAGYSYYDPFRRAIITTDDA